MKQVRGGWRWGLTFALIALALQDANCRAQAHVEEGSYRIAGRVVSALDGRPLRRAAVTILDTSRKPVASATADENGGFAFPGLKAGLYEMQGRMTGYMNAGYQSHGDYTTGIVTGAGVDTESLILKMTPQGSLSGQITDEAAEPVRHAMVALYLETHWSGDTSVKRWRSVQTDDLGRYSFDRLEPGRYYVAATATPWYAVHPSAVTSPGGIFVDAVDPTLDVAYAMTFYPDTTDADSASAIVVTGGREQEADIRLTPQPAVTIKVPRDPNDKTGGYPQLQKTAFGVQEFVQIQSQQSATEYILTGVPPGRYSLKQMPGQAGGAEKTMDVDVSGRNVAVDTARAVTEPKLKLKVTFKDTDGKRVPPGTVGALVRKDSVVASYSHAIDNQEEAQFEGVSPGIYYFAATQNYFASKVFFNGKEMTDGYIPVRAGEDFPVTVVLARGSMTVEGFARSGDKPVSGAMVLLLPADPVAEFRFTWKDQSNLDGSFAIKGVPPGRYLLVAIDDGWSLAWRRPEVVARYLSGAVPIAVSESRSGLVQVTEALAVQPR